MLSCYLQSAVFGYMYTGMFTKCIYAACDPWRCIARLLMMNWIARQCIIVCSEAFAFLLSWHHFNSLSFVTLFWWGCRTRILFSKAGARWREGPQIILIWTQNDFSSPVCRCCYFMCIYFYSRNVWAAFLSPCLWRTFIPLPYLIN